MSDKLDGGVVNHCQTARPVAIMLLSKLVDLSKQAEPTNYLVLKYFLSPTPQTIKLGHKHKPNNAPLMQIRSYQAITGDI